MNSKFGSKKCLIEIIVTEDCNNNCKYCIQHNFKNKKNIDKLDDVFNFILDFERKTEYKDIDIMIIGGEPLLNYDIANNIMNFCLDNHFAIRIVTNGLNLEKYIDTFIKLDDNKLLNLQISYDGNPIHDLYRCNTSKKIKENIKLLNNYKIDYSLKSTLPLNSLDLMFESFLDVISFNKSYNPTIDYNNDYLLNNEIDYISILNEQILKIVKYLYKLNIKTPPLHLFQWINDNKPICHAGIEFFSIDTSCNITKCHGCSFSCDKNEHIIGNIYDIDINNKINNMFIEHKEILKLENEECKNCTAILCRRCCSNNFNISDKLVYGEKWMDKNNEFLCNLYKSASKIIHALRIYNNRA